MNKRKDQAYPDGWDEARVRRLAEHYDKQTDFGIEEHRHRFAAWAAARATQRGFTSVGTLCNALKSSGVREFLLTCDVESVDEAAFERLHRAWCRAVQKSLINAGVEAKKVTFGRAAKLIAVYLKLHFPRFPVIERQSCAG